MLFGNCLSASLTTYSAAILDGGFFKAPFEWEQILKNNGPSTIIPIKHQSNLSTLLKEGFNLLWSDLFNEFLKFPKEGNSRG